MDDYQGDTATIYRNIKRQLLRLPSVPSGLELNINKLYDRATTSSNEARTDSLTGLPNGRSLTEILERESSRAKRHKRPMSMLMIDIDHFKKYNDTYGHEQGNEALKYLAGILKNSIRKEDVAVRYGGEEFVVLLIESDVGGAIRIARNIFDNLTQQKINKYVGNQKTRNRKYVDNKRFNRITVSIGVSSYPTNTGSTTDLISHADYAMYGAKNSGRFNYNVYTPKI